MNNPVVMVWFALMVTQTSTILRTAAALHEIYGSDWWTHPVGVETMIRLHVPIFAGTLLLSSALRAG